VELLHLSQLEAERLGEFLGKIKQIWSDIKPILRFIFGKTYKRFAWLLVTLGVGLVGQDIFLWLLETLFQVVIPEVSGLQTYLSMGIGLICICLGVGIFMRYQDKDIIEPATKGLSLTIPDNRTFEDVIHQIAGKLDTRSEIEGFEECEKKLYFKRFDLNFVEVQEIANKVAAAAKLPGFPSFSVGLENGVLHIKKEK